jgi:anti-sigma B factor antagonist
MMNIIERTLDDVTVLDLEGNLALEENKQFRLRVAATIDAGARKLILNLAGVPYMDSSGLGELISCYTAMQKLSGNVKLLHLNDRLQHLLAITKLSALLETFDSESTAISSFVP